MRIRHLMTFSALCFLLLLAGCANKSENEVKTDYSTYCRPIEGFACSDGTAVVITPEGKAITIQPPGDVWSIRKAWYIPSNEGLVYWLLSQYGAGMLYTSNVNQTDTIRIGEVGEVYEVLYICNDGVVFKEYADGNCQLCRYTFDDKKLSKWDVDSLSYPQDIIFAENTLSCMYVSYNQLYALPHDSQDPIALGLYEEDGVNLWTYVQNDGKMFLWKGEADALFMYDGAKRTTIGTATHDLDVESTKDGKLTVIAGDTLHIYRKGQQMQTLPFRSNVFYTDRGPLRESKVKDASVLYVLSEGNLYAIDKKGNYEKIYQSISQVHIENGRIVFLSNGRLNFASINQGSITDILQVDTGIGSFKTADNNAIFYKGEGKSSEATALYYVDFNEAIPQLIDESTYGDYVMCNIPGWVFYVSDEREHPQIKKLHTVMLYNTEESVLVAEDCNIGFLPRTYLEQMNPKAFYYFKLTLENEDYPWDLYRWNGTDSELVAHQVNRNVYFHGTGFHG